MNRSSTITRVTLLSGWCIALVGTISFGQLYEDILAFLVLLGYGLFSLLASLEKSEKRWIPLVNGLVASSILGVYFLGTLLPLMNDPVWLGCLIGIIAVLLVAFLKDWLGMGRWVFGLIAFGVVGIVLWMMGGYFGEIKDEWLKLLTFYTVFEMQRSFPGKCSGNSQLIVSAFAVALVVAAFYPGDPQWYHWALMFFVGACFLIVGFCQCGDEDFLVEEVKIKKNPLSKKQKQVGVVLLSQFALLMLILIPLLFGIAQKTKELPNLVSSLFEEEKLTIDSVSRKSSHSLEEKHTADEKLLAEALKEKGAITNSISNKSEPSDVVELKMENSDSDHTEFVFTNNSDEPADLEGYGRTQNIEISRSSSDENSDPLEIDFQESTDPTIELNESNIPNRGDEEVSDQHAKEDSVKSSNESRNEFDEVLYDYNSMMLSGETETDYDEMVKNKLEEDYEILRNTTQVLSVDNLASSGNRGGYPSGKLSSGGRMSPLMGANSSLGFSDSLEVQLDFEPVLSIRYGNGSLMPETVYLRAAALDTIVGDEFVSGGAANFPGFVKEVSMNESSTAQLNSNDWFFVFHKTMPGQIYLPGEFYEMNAEGEVPIRYDALNSVFSIDRGSEINNYVVRGVDLSQPYSVPSLIAVDSKVLSNYREYLLQLPLSKEDKNYLSMLVTDLVGKDPTLEEFNRKIARYFENNHTYDFDIRIETGKGHVLVRWLQSKSNGICGYYSGAYVLMARTAGIPSRVVLGATSNEFERGENRILFRNNNSHAWVEALDVSGKWIRVDPTRFAAVDVDSDFFVSPQEVPDFDSSIKDNEIAQSGEQEIEENNTSNIEPDVVAEAPDADIPEDKVVVEEPAQDMEEMMQERMETSLELVELKLSAETPKKEVLVEAKLDEDQKMPESVENESASENEAAPELNSNTEHQPIVKWLLIVLVGAIFVIGFIRAIMPFQKQNQTDESRYRRKPGRLLGEIEKWIGENPTRLSPELETLHHRLIKIRYGREDQSLKLKQCSAEFGKLVKQAKLSN